MWLCFYRLSVVSLTFSISYDLHICPVLLFSYASYISFNRDRTSYSHTGTLIFEFLPPLFYCIYDIDIQGIFALFSLQIYSVNLSLFLNREYWEHWFLHPVSYFPSPGHLFGFQKIIFMLYTMFSLEKTPKKLLQLILPYIILLQLPLKALPTMMAGTFTTQHLLFSQT